MTATDQIIVDDFIKKTKSEGLCINHVQIHRGDRLTATYDRLNRLRLPVYSISKGFTSCAFGIAEREGLVRLDEKLVDIFPEYVPPRASENLSEITLEHCLTMSAGQEGRLFMSDTPENRTIKDWIDYFFNSKFVHKPGTFWEYSNFNTYMVGCAIERRAGVNLLEYLRDRLFEPIGIGNPEWRMCPKGHVKAGDGLLLNIDELAAYGRLLLGFGRFADRQIVPEDYMRRASSFQIDNSSLMADDNRVYSGYGYGYQFLLDPKDDGYRSEGAYGQFAIAIPSKETVIAVMSLEGIQRRVGTLVFEMIVDRI